MFEDKHHEGKIYDHGCEIYEILEVWIEFQMKVREATNSMGEYIYVTKIPFGHEHLKEESI
jgi:hypothetical protein